MSMAEETAADLKGAQIGKVAIFATTTTHAVTDVGAEGIAGTGSRIRVDGQWFKWIATVDIYYAWGASGDEVDSAATTTGATAGFWVPAGTVVHEVATGTHFVHEAASGGRVYMAPSAAPQG